MSRRTKLIITALFLVLLAIPVVYVILTWSPANPLRFRIVKTLKLPQPSEPGLGPVQGWLVEVRNTSSVPVELIAPVYVRQQIPPTGRSLTVPCIGLIWSWHLRPPEFTPPGEYRGPIPPGGTVYLMACVAEDKDVRLGEVRVPYQWCSLTKWKCMLWSQRITSRFSLKVQSFLHRIKPSEDESILDVSLLAPGATQHPAGPPVTQ